MTHPIADWRGFILMAYRVMAYVVAAHVILAYIVMADRRATCSRQLSHVTASPITRKGAGMSGSASHRAVVGAYRPAQL